jgi:phosphomannomutase/phosphoglucomutase
MNPGIFREYDIRGIAGKDMTEDDVYNIGRGIGTDFIRRNLQHIAVGRDCRLTSEAYAAALIRGLTATGCHVLDIGLCPTPVLYYASHALPADGGVMVTASHNPKEYNGLKVNRGPHSLHGDELTAIYEITRRGDFESGAGTVTEKPDLINAYINEVAGNVTVGADLRIGVDAGNGMGGLTALPVFEKLGLAPKTLYTEPDGTFPHHDADPTVRENMTELIELVKDHQLDVGIGFDGDGDRIGVIAETGDIIYGDRLLILFARDVLQNRPGAAVIGEVKCSKTLYDDIEKHGGRPIMWKTGHSLIKKKMRQEKAPLAGEMSGHMFFADRYYGFDDALYAACRLLEILTKRQQPISTLLADVPETVSTPEIRVEFPDDQKFEIVQKVADWFKQRYDVVDIDGVRVLFDDGWGLVRASNTQPALVLRFEAMTEARLAEIRKTVEDVLEQFRG